MSIVVIEAAELRRLIEEAVEFAVARAKLADEWVAARTSPLPRRAFLKLASEGAFPVSHVGNKYLARRSHVDAYIESRRIRPESSGCETAPPAVSAGVAPNDDPVARALAAGRLRIVKKSG
jgi:hypothetical protein